MLTTLLLLIPLISILPVLLTKGKGAWTVALISSIINFGLTLFAITQFDAANPDPQFVTKASWIVNLGVSFYVGMDGISLLMVLLTNLLLPLIILTAFNKNYERPNIFFALVLLMQCALIGVFVSLDAFLYYIFWELALVPIYFIILGWGGENRNPITLKFFIYTLNGSLLMLIAFIFLYLQVPAPSNFTYDAFRHLSLSPIAQGIVFWAFFIAFAIKMPIFPFHTWQPDTYTVAPPQGTMLLSGIMLKMGIYSVIRWMLPILPDAILQWGNTVIILSVIGIVYGAWIAIEQKDIKRLFAYSSFSHVGLIAAGIFTPSLQGLQGGIYQMFSHGINVVGLFFIAQIIFDRWESYQIDQLGGIANKAPKLTVLFAIIMLGSVALPLTNGFVGEFLLLNAVFRYQQVIGAIAGLTIILGAVYMLRTFQKTMLGDKNEDTPFLDLKPTEMLVLSIIAILVIVMGVYPDPFLKLTEPAAQKILNGLTTLTYNIHQ